MTDLKKILSKMTIPEKIGQLMQLRGADFTETEAGETGPNDNLNINKHFYKSIGSALSFANPTDTTEVQKTHMEKDPLKIPMIFMMDVIHGFRTMYPIPLALGCSFDPELMKECCRVAAREASASGIHVTFAPMVDYVRDARWGRVMETCGEDPLLNCIMGAAQVEGFQGDDLKNENNIAACAKHFAAYGGAEAGRDYSGVELSEHILREYYLPAYKACVDAGVSMIMTSFNTLNGVPAVANEWLEKVLREEWGFKGVVISDYAAIAELITHGVAADDREAAKKAFGNLCDIEMVSNKYYNCLEEMIKDGTFPEKMLDEAVLRVLELKDRLGLFEDPYRGINPNAEKEVYLLPESRETVRRAAEESAVLLKNNGILPLSDNIKKIALIGPFADNKKIIGEWPCMGKNEECVTVKEGISALVPDARITVAEGCGYYFDDLSEEGFSKAVAAAKDADVVILCVGEPQEYSGESNNRADIELPGAQKRLIPEITAANPNTVALVFSGRPNVLCELEQNAAAILHMWFPGTEGGNAAANLIFGRANPCGKITMSFPKKTGQCPIYYNHTNTGRPKLTNDDEFVRFISSYIDCGPFPLYSFGYGLSYSDFEYESLELSSDKMTADEKITVKVTVKNKSERAGKETVMLYLRDVCASNARPIQQLIAFSKEKFEAGERKTVEFEINEKMLRFPDNQNKFISEKGVFEISTGYADHLILTGKFSLI